MINPYIGEVTAFGFNFAPEGWLQCKGQLLSVQEYKQLFSVLGTQFGGDGKTTFGLPNFPGQFCMSAAGGPPSAGRNALPGETTLFPYQPPPGWIKSRGQLLQINQNTSLFQILRTTFGGDGVTTFGVPNMGNVPPFKVPGNYGFSAWCIANVPIGSTDQGFQGEIKIFPSTVPPNGWLPCDGRLMSISDDTHLFSLIGVTYGGDGSKTFALPKITVLPGLQSFICKVGVYPQRP